MSIGTGGRPPQPLDIDAGREHFIGIKLAGRHAAGVLDRSARRHPRPRGGRSRSSHEPDAVVSELAALVDALSGRRRPASRPSASGSAAGRAHYRWCHAGRRSSAGSEVDLGAALASATGCPVALANDLDSL